VDASSLVRNHSSLALECPICFDCIPSEKSISLTCSHSFCNECLAQHVRSRMEGGDAISIPCPLIRAQAVPTGSSGSGCGHILSQGELQRILGEREFAVLERRALEAAVASDRSLHFCPTPDCTYVVSWAGDEDGPPRVDCPLCLCSRCLLCGGRHAAHRACESATEAPSGPAEAARHAEEEQATTEYMARANIRKCWRCGSGVVKSSGCDKMKCRCGYRFCYKCGAENAQCRCTPSSHGFVDNVTMGADFSHLGASISPP
jgi:hypothetical protein